MRLLFGELFVVSKRRCRQPSEETVAVVWASVMARGSGAEGGKPWEHLLFYLGQVWWQSWNLSLVLLEVESGPFGYDCLWFQLEVATIFAVAKLIKWILLIEARKSRRGGAPPTLVGYRLVKSFALDSLAQAHNLLWREVFASNWAVLFNT